ncbi:MAG: valine--tRNA ligase [Candidatus Diapherotrites archaeon]
MECKIAEKAWSKELEKPLIEKWRKEEAYAFNPSSKKKVYSIDTPPPYVNTPVHIGHATTYSIMDMFARYKRMKGFEVLFPLGLDNNGLPIEMAAEKKYGIQVGKTPREEFNRKCREMLEESGLESMDSFYKSGISFNSWKKGTGIGEVYETDSADYRGLTQDTFIEMYKKGLIYEDERVNNYCPGCKTTLADAEVEYEEKESVFSDIVFKCKETGEELVVGTTRPELVCTCGMLIFNPEDARYKKLEGKTAISPIFGKEIPIKAHPLAQIEKGTGLVMMCSFGDLSDIRFFREQNLKPIIAINANGLMNEQAGFLNGLAPREAREKMVQALKEKNLLKGQRKIVHTTPVCERSGDEIEFVSMKEFYVKQIEYKEKMKKLAEKMKFYAPESKQILLDWIESVSIDWPISRRRYYATEVPLWYCKKCNFVQVPPKGKYYHPWKEAPPEKKCPRCRGTEWRGEERVFDTWFDSSISPMYVLKYERNPKFFSTHWPCTLRPQGKEIIRTWLYYTLLKDFLLTGKPAFEHVWINYFVVDENGNKMSKSVGNVVDPQVVLDKFGAEPFRLWAASEGNLQSTDFRCSFERIEGAGKTLTKLWNVARFISSFEFPKKPKKLEALDEWILKELNELVRESDKRMNEYDVYGTASALRQFLWDTLASHYLELAKSRAYNRENFFSKAEQESALYTLHYCLQTMLKLWAPILPLIAAKLYNDLYNANIHTEEFPKAGAEKSPISKQGIEELNGAVWKAKKDAGKALNAEISKAVLPKKLKALEKDLKACHKIKQLSWGETLELSL